ncbi:multidrug resistance-associated protein 1 [Elysia marginata]|uniref:Multidrug resistance-associated protein 1 n=1 Tax=Elysia marginata TaxID=1093978 RepID=A0AAV4FX37_9GAST|nr:multidrug resistance-associated protein 1 [Elysia marginata]
MTSASKKDKTTGEIVSIMAEDCDRLINESNMIFFLFTSPIQVTVALILLYKQIGNATFVGLGLLLTLLPLNAWCGKKIAALDKEKTKVQDDRVKFMNEIINGIKVGLKAAISVKEATFKWDPSMKNPTLKDINLTIPEGSLTAVVGLVGAGKSSLLSAMLGEIERHNGTVTVQSRTAYVPQEAWILNASLRDNLVFGSEYDSKRYKKVIDACALKDDLKVLAAGDRTEIGEKGINLSGGQKQRVSLARAVYDQADIYLLDDPLSAVDAHVGKHIFNHVIGHHGMLAGKTRVLVTHGIHWLPLVDNVVVLRDGRVSEQGTYKELLTHDGAFAQFLKDALAHESPESEFIDVKKDKGE